MIEPFTIVCGVSSLTGEKDLEALLSAGVGEIYTGYVSARWLSRFGMEVSPNRRYFVERQITDRKLFKRIGDRVHAHNAQLVVALNEHYYLPDQRDYLREIVEESVNAGATGFIVANLETLCWLKEFLDDSFQVIVSTEAGVFNTHTVRLFAEHGANRIIFARQMLLSEMKSIVGEHPSLEFEAFIAREYCPNSSSYCFMVHGFGRRTHFCAAHTGKKLWDRVSKEEILWPEVMDASLVGGQGFDSTRSQNYYKALFALHRCGFCALGELKNIGIKYLKIPGRSNSALEAVSLLRRLLEQNDLSPKTCRQVIGSEDFCKNEANCYYRIKPLVRPVSRHIDRLEVLPAIKEHPDSSEQSPLFQNSSLTTVAGQSELACYLPFDAVNPELLGCLQQGRLPRSFVSDWERLYAKRAASVLGILDDKREKFFFKKVPSRIYLGLEHCWKRLPGAKTLLERAALVLEAGFTLTLVTPVVVQSELTRISDVLSQVFAGLEASAECVVNDWGLLSFAGRQGGFGELVAGRLLNRMKRNQYTGFGKQESEGNLQILSSPTEEQERYFGHPWLVEPFYQRMLISYGVRRVEFDVLPSPLSKELSGEFQYSLYAPWTFLTTSRACPVAICGSEVVASHPTEQCLKSCEKFWVLPQYSDYRRRVVQSGVSSFMDCTDDIRGFTESMRAVGRLIFEPVVPR